MQPRKLSETELNQLISIQKKKADILITELKKLNHKNLSSLVDQVNSFYKEKNPAGMLAMLTTLQSEFEDLYQEQHKEAFIKTRKIILTRLGEERKNLDITLESKQYEVSNKYLREKLLPVITPASRDEYTDTVNILWATLYGYTDIAIALIREKIELDILPNSRSPLELAVGMKRRKIFDALIEAGVDLNVQNKTGATALMNSINRKQTNMALALIDAGADITIKSFDGRTAKQNAETMQDKTVLAALNRAEENAKKYPSNFSRQLSDSKILKRRYKEEIASIEARLESDFMRTFEQQEQKELESRMIEDKKKSEIEQAQRDIEKKQEIAKAVESQKKYFQIREGKFELKANALIKELEKYQVVEEKLAAEVTDLKNEIKSFINDLNVDGLTLILETLRTKAEILFQKHYADQFHANMNTVLKALYGSEFENYFEKYCQTKKLDPKNETTKELFLRDGFANNKSAQTLLECKNNKSSINLFWAIIYCQNDVATSLLANKTDPNELNLYGISPLYLAATLGNLDITTALIEAGANINFQDASGLTSLMRAVGFKHTDIAHLLMTNQKSIATLKTKKGHAVHYYLNVECQKLEKSIADNMSEDDPLLFATISKAASDGEKLIHRWKDLIEQNQLHEERVKKVTPTEEAFPRDFYSSNASKPHFFKPEKVNINYDAPYGTTETKQDVQATPTTTMTIQQTKSQQVPQETQETVKSRLIEEDKSEQAQYERERKKYQNNPNNNNQNNLPKEEKVMNEPLSIDKRQIDHTDPKEVTAIQMQMNAFFETYNPQPKTAVKNNNSVNEIKFSKKEDMPEITNSSNTTARTNTITLTRRPLPRGNFHAPSIMGFGGPRYYRR